MAQNAQPSPQPSPPQTATAPAIPAANPGDVNSIDAILAASPQPPVIIVMSDHGPRSRSIEPATATNDVLRERFGTLFAAYTPGLKGVFPQDTTPAEVLVDLLNAYFDAQLPQPASGTFVSDGSNPFRYTRVPDPPPPS